VLRDDDDADVGVPFPQFVGQLDALGGERGWHPDVEEHDVGLVLVEQRPEFGRLGRHAEDGDPLDGVEDRPCAFTHEVVVLADENRDGVYGQRHGRRLRARGAAGSPSGRWWC
jgi:hypothetical protein